MSITIRPATIEDAETIMQFIVELAVYEKAEHEVLATQADIEHSIFGANSTVDAVICEQGKKPIGFAVYFYNYSTWLGKNGLFLEDLYVTPESRGIGAGKALLKHLNQIALDRGCGRFEWNVLDWNTPSIEFYESIGAKPQSEWIGYRLDHDAMKTFANS